MPAGRGRLIRDQPHVDTALLGANQRLDDAGAGCQPIGTDQDFTFSVVDRADCEGSAVLLGGEADRDRRNATDETGTAGKNPPITSERAIRNTLRRLQLYR